MPIISGGGSRAFTGGTLTQPLILAMASPTDVPLQLKPPAGATAAATDQVEVYDDTGSLIGYWDAAGNMLVNPSDATHTTSARLSTGGTAGGATLILQGNADLRLTIPGTRQLTIADALNNVFAYIPNDGALRLLAHAAPASGALAAGDMALWFDQTNAAGKLMVKAKTADGTVVTATIPLT